MDLLSLRYFQTTARLEHISRAAAELRVAQPSLSRTIARLEAELGVPLFDRRGRSIRLNRFGSTFLRRVDRVLGELEAARQEVADAAGLAHGNLALASETLLTLQGALRGFVADHPTVEVRLYQSSVDRMRDQLLSGEVDLCLASQPITGPAFRTKEILNEEVMLCVPLNHRLAGREVVKLTDIADEPIITTRPGYWQRTLIDRLYERRGLAPRIVCEGDELAATIYLIAGGLGIGVMPSIGRQEGTLAQVGWLRLDEPGCQRRLSVVWRSDAYLSAAAQLFREYVQDFFAGGPPGSAAPRDLV